MQRPPMFGWAALPVVVLFTICGCDDATGTVDDPPKVVEGTCVVGDDVPDALDAIACTADFTALSSLPASVTLPGARSVKTIVDRADGGALHFQNSQRYAIHHAFASAHLSGDGRPVVPDLTTFNSTEYFSPDRRFMLGAVTHYEATDTWALEIAPYDTMTAEMLRVLYTAVAAHAFFGPALAIHPTSEAVAAVVATLDLPVVTTDALYAGIDYQPLSLATGIGRLRFVTAATIDSSDVSPEDIVVLDDVPNDISVVQGIISAAFQTPLSHVNVLAQNRRTPNMGLRGALENPQLRALEGEIVRLVVAADSYSVEPATLAEAEAAWEAQRPAPVVLPPYNVAARALVDVQMLVDVHAANLREAIVNAVPAFGGKAAHYSVLAQTDGVIARRAFVVPIAHYVDFMHDNGFEARVAALLDDASFASDAAARATALAELRADMRAAPLSPTFVAQLQEKIAADFADVTALRFRTSTNSEDLDGFPCAGCYESHTGTLADWADVEDAVKETWSTIWLARSFEERRYYGVEHASVAMALLVHENFADEEANGVAVTANVFDAAGIDPAFYVNVQFGGDVEVVHPQAGISSDQFLYYFGLPNQPVSYISHSSLIAAGAAVLSGAQTHALGTALSAIHDRFGAAYGPAAGATGFYAMDVEFKLEGGAIWIKQARPYPGRSAP